ncbi:MAG: radical SAM protein [Candidatus Pacearchaeota archaeon]
MEIYEPNQKFAEYCKELKKDIKLNDEILFLKGLQLNLNSFEIDVAKNRCYYAYPPTGLQYLASAIENKKLKIKILDLNFEFLKRVIYDENFNYKKWINILKEYLEKNNPSIIGVSNSFAVYNSNFLEILRFLKDKGKIIITGGHNATYEGEMLLNEGLCHFVCTRESENKINYLLDNIFENDQTNPTPGILFKYKGEIYETCGKKDVVILRGNLINVHDLVPIEEYCKVGTLSPYSRMSGKDKPFATIIFNRGCEGGCRFCGVCDYMGIGVRSRDIKDVLDEMEYLYKERGIRHFEFLDDDFARFKDRAIEVLQGIIDRGLKITWASNNGFIARTLDEEIMEKMRDSGCIGFKIGVESGNPEILLEIRKPGNLETFRKFSQQIKKFPEMFIADNYIFGFPNENFKKIMQSYKFSIEMDLDWSSYAVYQHNVSYFGNKEERRKKKTNIIGDFIPTKDRFKGKLKTDEKIYVGPDIFNIPDETIPNRDQLNHIWFTFNLIRNFVYNKNLTPNGNPKKFISWTLAIEERYPTHPYINFFLAIAHLLDDDKEKSMIQLEKTKKNLLDKYWKERFDQFQFSGIVENFPKNKKEAQEIIDLLRKKYRQD